MDQTSAESVKAAVDRVAVTYGRIDVLYLNAGTYRHQHSFMQLIYNFVTSLLSLLSD